MSIMLFFDFCLLFCFLFSSIIISSSSGLPSTKSNIQLDCPMKAIDIEQPLKCYLNISRRESLKETKVIINFGDGQENVLDLNDDDEEEESADEVDKFESFGIKVPHKIDAPTTTDVAYDFLFTNTELQQDSFISGIEFYAVGQGQIDLVILKFNECGGLVTSSNSSCADYISGSNESFPTYTYHDFLIKKCNNGYNLMRIEPPVFFSRGSMLYANTKRNSKLAIDTSGAANYSDFIWPNTRLNASTNWRFYTRLITNSTKSKPPPLNLDAKNIDGGAGGGAMKRRIEKKYDATGVYELSARLMNTEIFTNETIVVANLSRLCQRIQVEIRNVSVDPLSPTPFKRSSKSIYFDSVENITCWLNAVTVQKRWFIEKLNFNYQKDADKDDKDRLKQTKIYETDQQHQLRFQIEPNRLAYGLHRVCVEVNLFLLLMNATSTTMKRMSNNDTNYTTEFCGYVRIEPTGLVVNGLNSGITELILGSRQSIRFRPDQHSFDHDRMCNVDRLSFVYYCRSLDQSGRGGSYPIDEQTGRPLSLYDFFKGRTQTEMSSTTTCFNKNLDFTFDKSGNELIINSGGLQYFSNRSYQFNITVQYFGKLYWQSISIIIKPMSILPLVGLKCRFKANCLPDSSHFVINANNRLIIDGLCKSGCDKAKKLEFRYLVYFGVLVNRNDATGAGGLKWRLMTNQTAAANWIKGDATSELTLNERLFQKFYSSVQHWKITLNVKAKFIDNLNLIGSSSIQFRVNQRPFGGHCLLINRTTTTTEPEPDLVSVNCVGWTDEDGHIDAYELYATNKGASVGGLDPILLAKSLDGQFSDVKLPCGSKHDDFWVYLSVKIIDNNLGWSTYALNQSVQVRPNQQLVNNLVDQLSEVGDHSVYLRNLSVMRPHESIRELLSFTLMMNSIDLNNHAHQSHDYDLAENKQAKAKEALMKYLREFKLTDLTSMKMVSSVLSALTDNIKQITRASASHGVIKSDEIINGLEDQQKDAAAVFSFDDLNQIKDQVIDATANILAALSAPLNGLQPFLIADLTAITASDADNEASIIEKQKIQLANIKSKVNQIMNRILAIISPYLSLNQPHRIKKQHIEISYTKSLINNANSNDEIVNQLIQINDFQLNLPPIIQMLQKQQKKHFDDDESAAEVIQMISMMRIPTTGFNGDNETNVSSSRSLNIEFYEKSNREIGIYDQNSRPIDLWIPHDDRSAAITTQISKDSSRIYSGGLIVHRFKLNGNNVSVHIELNVTNASTTAAYLMLLKFGGADPYLNSTRIDYDKFKLFCPIEAYQHHHHLFFMNMNETNGFRGQLSVGLRQLNHSELFCSSNNATLNLSMLLTDSATTTAAAAAAAAAVTDDYSLNLFTSGCYYYDDFNSKWSTYGVEVLNDTNRTHTHCSTTHLTEFAGGGWQQILPTPIDFGYVFANAQFTANPLIYSTVILITCLYVLMAIWCARRDRKDEQKIAFHILDDDDENIDDENKYFYEVILFTGDQRDAGTDSKVQLIVYGENRETEAKTLNRRHRKKSDYQLKRGCIDSYLMSVEKSLGSLNYLRVWHDNSGAADLASWYLKYIIVHDLQTREKFYFMCEKWLALEKEDGLIDRILPVMIINDANSNDGENGRHLSSSSQKQQPSGGHHRRISQRARENMSDEHLWFSVFARPIHSAFTRLDRLTCCVVLLYLSMLMNILYYDRFSNLSANDQVVEEEENEKTSYYFRIGPFVVTPQQIVISLITNLIIYPPSFLLIQIFRRSKRRISRAKRLSDLLMMFKLNRQQRAYKYIDQMSRGVDYHQSYYENLLKWRNHCQFLQRRSNSSRSNSNSISNKSSAVYFISFPWWFKLIGYFLSLAISITSAFFILMKGIQFGDQKVYDWLTSLILTFITSILFTQPIQVILAALFFMLVLKSSPAKYRRNLNEIEIDPDDDGQPINKNFPLSLLYSNAANDSTTSFYVTPASSLFNYKQQSNDVVSDNVNITEAKCNRLRELKTRKFFREFFLYLIYLFVLLTIAFVNNQPNYFKNGYRYQKNLKSIFGDNGDDDQHQQFAFNFKRIKNVDDLWRWTSGRFLDALKPTANSSFLNDQVSLLIGDAILMRQIRVKKDSCKLEKNFKGGLINFCAGDYNFFNRETSNFNINWQPPSDREEELEADSSIEQAFKYTRSEELNGGSYPYFGSYTNYYGGGYVFRLSGGSNNNNKTSMRDQLKLLRRLNWLDRQTRALIIEFSLFNANINLFAHCLVLFELLPHGVILKQMRFNSLNLNDFNYSTGNRSQLNRISFRLASQIVYILFVVYFIVVNFKLLVRRKLNYFKRFWSYVELSIILFSLTAFMIYLNRLQGTFNLKENLKSLQTTAATNSSPSSSSSSSSSSSLFFIRLQAISYWTDLYQLCLGACTFLGTLKLLKLLRFNRRIAIFLRSIKLSFQDLFGFSLLFVIVWLSFVQLFYLIYFADQMNFSSLIKSMQICFQMMIGNLNGLDKLFQPNCLLGSIIYSLFTILIVFTFLNMFFSILNRTYAKCKCESSANSNNEDDELPEPITYIRSMLVYYLKKLRLNNKPTTTTETTETTETTIFIQQRQQQQHQKQQQQQQQQPIEYRDGVSHFPKKINELINLMLKIYNDNLESTIFLRDQIAINNNNNNNNNNKNRMRDKESIQLF